MAPRTLPPLPVRPLLAAFRRQPPPESEFAGTRLAAIRSAGWLTTPLGTADLAALLRTFAEQVHPVAWHADRVAAQAGFVRHGVGHLLNGTDLVGVRFGRCVLPGGTYAVAGAGRRFWAAVWKAADPDVRPDWSADVQAGLERCGLLDRAPDPLAAAGMVYADLQREFPPLDANDLDGFFRLVGRMTGREFPPADESVADGLRHRLRTVRTRVPLRQRLKERSVNAQTGMSVPPELGDLDDAFSPLLPDDVQRELLVDVVALLRERFAVHPLEVTDLMGGTGIPACADESTGRNACATDRTFHGFATETFRFLSELAEHNSKGWMDAHRERYAFFVREPVVELCRAVGERYVVPVLSREHGWELETDPRPGRALTSIAKNDYGRGGPYTPDVWVTFYRKASGGKRHDAQLFVRVSDTGVSFGFHLGRGAREAGRRFRKAVQEHGELLFNAVRAGGVNAVTFRGATAVHTVSDPAGLRAWALEKELFAERTLPTDHLLLRSDDLAGEVLIAFDRLLPLMAAALDDDPRPALARRGGEVPAAPPFDRAAFRRATFLGDTWLSRALDLLTLKKQLILHGVPGTGKTHVARSLARLLTDDRPGGVRLVQFHPGYSYEEFVEGIRPRSVEANGRTEISYPVEPGVLSEFAAEAEANPALPFVLVVDEINRGNLPRIFGELLFLLEYRDQAVTLPHSKRPFRLPGNLLLLGTMNSTDRSTVALDQALRRRFSFVEMTADAAVLAGWLEQNTADDGTFAPRVVKLFDELNRRLARDLGPDRQIGHSFFMVPGLTDDGLRAVWAHHVLPTLAEYFAPRPVPPGYDLGKLFDPPRRKATETV